MGASRATRLVQEVAGRRRTITQRIRTRLLAPIEFDAAVVRNGGSVGIAMLHEDGQNMGALLGAADEQMYEAKKAGNGPPRTAPGMLQPLTA